MSDNRLAFMDYTEQPPVSVYNPAFYSSDLCLARRTSEKHADNRWTYKVYAGFQCKSKPVAGSDLCEGCQKRETKGIADAGWHGRMNEEIPADSHIVGSAWFYSKPKWTGVPKVTTAARKPSEPVSEPTPEVEEEPRDIDELTLLKERVAILEGSLLDAHTEIALLKGKLMAVSAVLGS